MIVPPIVVAGLTTEKLIPTALLNVSSEHLYNYYAE